MDKVFAPTILTIFGATGDLMARMVAPSLLNLAEKKHLPHNFKIIAFGRREFDDDTYKDFLLQEMLRLGAIPSSKETNSLMSLITYHKGTFDNPDSYNALAATLSAIDASWNTRANKLFYLPIPPVYYETVFDNLSEAGLVYTNAQNGGWTRILVEKPFGKDLASAEQLDRKLTKFFEEKQVYRIDHYLSKETVQNILSFRFSNNIFTPSLNNQFVSRIHIRLNEVLGIEDRGDYYDSMGALRDVGANHLLQLAALMMMDRPAEFNSEGIRAARADFFQSLIEPDEGHIRLKTRRAQFKGYPELDGVARDSQTETYFRIELESQKKQWQGVPIILEGGKLCEAEQKDITIYYKNPLPSYRPPGEIDVEDYVRFDVSDQEKIELSLVFKEPSHEESFRRNMMHYHTYGDNEEKERIVEYEFVLLDALKGDQVRFVSTDEVKGMWQVIDPILAGWQAGWVPLEVYSENNV